MPILSLSSLSTFAAAGYFATGRVCLYGKIMIPVACSTFWVSSARNPKGFVKGVMVSVRACQIEMTGGVCPYDAVICKNVFEAKGFHCLSILSNGPEFGTYLHLEKCYADSKKEPPRK